MNYKNVAKPIGFERHAAQRRATRAQWEDLQTVPASEKQASVAALDREIDLLRLQSESAQNAARNEVILLDKEIAETKDTEILAAKKEQRAAAILSFSNAVNEFGPKIQAKQNLRATLNHIKTNEEKTVALQKLDEEAAAAEKFGRQPMTAEEIAQKEKDEEEHLKQLQQLEATAYARARQAEYPPDGEQIDALWKGLEALAKGAPLPEEAAVILEARAEIKKRHPKPPQEEQAPAPVPVEESPAENPPVAEEPPPEPSNPIEDLPLDSTPPSDEEQPVNPAEPAAENLEAEETKET
jgi:hypothetical protein